MALIPHKVVRLGAIAMIGIIIISNWHMAFMFAVLIPLAYFGLLSGKDSRSESKSYKQPVYDKDGFIKRYI